MCPLGFRSKAASDEVSTQPLTANGLLRLTSLSITTQPIAPNALSADGYLNTTIRNTGLNDKEFAAGGRREGGSVLLSSPPIRYCYDPSVLSMQYSDRELGMKAVTL